MEMEGRAQSAFMKGPTS